MKTICCHVSRGNLFLTKGTVRERFIEAALTSENHYHHPSVCHAYLSPTTSAGLKMSLFSLRRLPITSGPS